MEGINIHLPAAAEPSTELKASDTEPTLEELIKLKDEAWAKFQTLSEVLQSHKVNMKSGLTTLDGFPRDDIDVAQVRSVRVELIRVNNDYEALMAKVEVALHRHYAETQAELESAPQGSSKSQASNEWPKSSGEGEISTSSTKPAEPAEPARDTDIPFAKVNSVMPGSPAEDAGLKAGDEVVQFGPVDWTNHEELKRIARIVQNNEGMAIPVRLLRRSEAKEGSISAKTLTLTPRQNWGGRGMLGCHLVPHS